MPIVLSFRTALQARVIGVPLLLATALQPACSGTIGNEAADPDGLGNEAGGGRDTPANGGSKAAPPAPGVDLSCQSSVISPGKSPLRRLTNAQFGNSLKDLFKNVLEVGSIDLPAETPVGGYDNNVLGQFAAPTLLEGYRNTALNIARAAGVKEVVQKLAPCAPGKDELVCGVSYLERWASKIFRRPAASGELGRLEALFKATRASDGYAAAVADTMQAMLSSPQFLYRVEAGGDDAGAVLKLDGYDVASRLSFLLWDSIPDDELTSMAASDGLGTASAIERQVDRMMNDPRAKTAIAQFHSQWLMLDKVISRTKDTATFPKWNQQVAKSLSESTRRYVDNIFWNTPTVTDLLTDTHAFVDASTNWIWGTSSKSTGMGLVDLGRGKRSGLLTQAGLMAAFAKPSVDSGVARGLFVMRQFLCTDTPEPPPNVSTTLEPPSPGSSPKTARQNQEESHAEPVCAGCHASIDGIGFGFGHYDAVGAWRDKDNGIGVDASGELVGTRDVDGKFDGAIELAQRLSKSVQVQQCIATHWFRWSFGRTENDEDSCALLPIVNRFVKSNGDLRDLVKALATSNAFRYRQKS